MFEKISELLDQDQAAVILNPANRFYLSGFESSDGVVFISEKRRLFLTDMRYFEAAKQVVTEMEVMPLKSFYDDLKALLSQENIKTVLVETDFINVSQYESLKEKLQIEISKENDLSNRLSDLRAVKTAKELENIRAAQDLTDRTFKFITERIASGRTEKEIMLEMEFYMRKLGSKGVSFDFIVASGKNSSVPHAVPTDKKIEKGDFVTMDFGAVINGYRSDMTRTVCVGFADETQKAVYDTVLKAQNAAINFACAGKNCSDVDKVAREIIDLTDFKGTFTHALGHSVGIEIHESPSFSPKSTDVLKSGMIMTVEPGIYIENTYGVRIEDMILITENGNVNLTASEKELIIL